MISLNGDLPEFEIKQKLSELKVDIGDDIHVINKLLGEQENLTSLDINDGIANVLLNEETFNKIMAMSKLKTLKIYLSADYDFVGNLPSNNNLEVLEITCKHSENNKFFMQALISKFPNLQEVSLSNYSYWNAPCWEGDQLNFLNDLQSLKKFHVETTHQGSVLPHLDLQMLKDATISFPVLINENPKINYEEMIQFLQNHHLLENLEIKAKMIPKNILIFIKKLKHLKKTIITRKKSSFIDCI